MMLAGFREIDDIDGAGHAQQFVFGIEQAELAAVAGGELEDGDAGFAARLLEFIFSNQVRMRVVGEDGAVLADEVGPVLAVAAESDGAFHVAFHREIDVAGRDAARFPARR